MKSRVVHHIATTLILASAVTMFGCRSPVRDNLSSARTGEPQMAQTKERDVKTAVPSRLAEEIKETTAPARKGKGDKPVIFKAPDSWLPPQIEIEMPQTPDKKIKTH